MLAALIGRPFLSPTLSPVRPVATLRRDHNQNGGFAKGMVRTGFHPETMKSATWLGWCLEELKQRDQENVKWFHESQGIFPRTSDQGPEGSTSEPRKIDPEDWLHSSFKFNSIANFQICQRRLVSKLFADLRCTCLQLQLVT